MSIDYSLIAEAETLIPKVNQDNSHILHCYSNWYQNSKTEEDMKYYEDCLRKAVIKARLQLADITKNLE